MQRIFAVNAIGPILCAQQAVKRMSYRHNGRGGSVVNISSASARLGSPGEYVDYAASKGALETFTTGFAKEVAREGIRVNCIMYCHRSLPLRSAVSAAAAPSPIRCTRDQADRSRSVPPRVRRPPPQAREHSGRDAKWSNNSQ
jgi:NAD(P)-dependent dehydrogenase (short-subunit alcohol dehydrogenase family)